MRILVIGEGMVEFTREQDRWVQGIGGDTLNTAIHLARLGADVAYASALGEDMFSAALREAIVAEGVDASLVATDAQRQCGIYFVSTDAAGERSFTYWRSQSAARAMMETLDADRLGTAMAEAELVHLSLISLAILPEEGRERLRDLVRQAKAAGTRISFDSNYRPILWQSREEAARWSAAMASLADIGLPTLEDEVALGTAGDAAGVSAAWSALGCHEVVVKCGSAGCLVPGGEAIAAQAVAVVDTSGAGDSFNAAYLHGRLSGLPPAEAARRATKLAGWVVGRKGAIPAAEPNIYS
ncbi:sugar kinase [Aurantiacibacter xanthus]|uniref:Sugar kinase n=1 Tax=Aurantiacibacter xanthus TaxID=1784712 RepID=A0A3A1P353_9SPHN|nr:sugar kinase [Aurantiacibacter xanthus]RIV84123.1 sugar kinase [Aurantiacibacter xanthus]